MHLRKQNESSFNWKMVGLLYQFVRDDLLWLNIYLVTLCPVPHSAVSTIFKYTVKHKTHCCMTPKPSLLHWRLNHYEVHFEDFCTCFNLHRRIKQLHIKISQPYTQRGTHIRAHTSSRAVTQGQRRRFIFIMGKGAKSCWYEGGYINANCIGELLVLEKVCM